MRDHSTIMCHRESRVGRRSFSTKVWLDLLGNCIFVVNSRKVAEASSLRAAAGSRCHFVPPNCAKVTHQKSARRVVCSPLRNLYFWEPFLAGGECLRQWIMAARSGMMDVELAASAGRISSFFGSRIWANVRYHSLGERWAGSSPFTTHPDPRDGSGNCGPTFCFI